MPAFGESCRQCGHAFFVSDWPIAEATAAARHGGLLGSCRRHATCALATVAWYAGGIMERDDYPTVPMTLGNMRQLGIRSLAVIFRPATTKPS
jgi:hypothetical protein